MVDAAVLDSKDAVRFAVVLDSPKTTNVVLEIFYYPVARKRRGSWGPMYELIDRVDISRVTGTQAVAFACSFYSGDSARTAP